MLRINDKKGGSLEWCRIGVDLEPFKNHHLRLGLDIEPRVYEIKVF
jgi:hypothetical protein